MSFYFFPGLMYDRIKFLSVHLSDRQLKGNYNFPNLNDDYYLARKRIESRKEVYDNCKTQYMGLGTLLQFIPGTNAFKARNQLSMQITESLPDIHMAIDEHYGIKDEDTSIFNYKYRMYLKAKSYLSEGQHFIFGPITTWFNDIARKFNTKSVSYNQETKLFSIFSRFPLIYQLFIYDHCESKPKFLFGLLNPLYLLDDFLEWLHYSANCVLNIGQPVDNKSTIVGAILKGIVALGFGLVQLPIKTARHLIDLPLNAVRFIFLDPLFEVIDNALKYLKNKSLLVVTVEDMREIRALRKEATEKGKEKKSDPNKERKQYSGIAYRELYGDKKGANDLVNKDQLITVQGSQRQIQRYTKLLSIVGMYKGNNQKPSEIRKPLNLQQQL